MSHPTRNAAIIAHSSADADFAQSTLRSFDCEARRYESVEQYTRELQLILLDEAPDVQRLSVAILAGPLEELAAGKAAGALRAISSSLPIFVAGHGNTVSSAVELMKQGANDVVDLPCDRDQLWKRFCDLADRSQAQSSFQTRSEEFHARLSLLTKAEHEVLAAMLDGLANKQIAQRLGIGLRTVELRRSKIMRKMQAKSVAELVKFICLAGHIHE